MNARLLAVVLLVVLHACGSSGEPPASATSAVSPPPPGTGFDYQLGGDGPLPDGAGVVVRDWFAGAAPARDVYAVCYVNGFQTQPDQPDVDRLDEQSAWSDDLVLTELGDDPGWEGELLLDVSTPDRSERIVAQLAPALATCAEKGFDAVEFDNLDSWTRFDGTTLSDAVPFARGEALAHAQRLATAAHQRGLAVAQKNTPQLSEDEVTRVGFDFAIAEECARFEECGDYVDLHGERVLVVEYDRASFEAACRDWGDRLSVVLRDVGLEPPGSAGSVRETC